MTRTRMLAGLGVVLVIAGLSLMVLRMNARRTPAGGNKFQGSAGSEAPAGGPAADFSLSDLAGRTVTLSSLRGKVVLLNVWATWCGPCREEMPSMEQLYQKLKGRKDFAMLAISEDRNGLAAVAPYVAKQNYHFDVLLDPDSKVGQAYDITGVPETFIIDRQGQIVAHHLGAFDWSRDDVRDALLELIGSKGS